MPSSFVKSSFIVDLLMPAQLMFGNSDVNARGSGLPLVALSSLAMQAPIVEIIPGYLSRSMSVPNLQSAIIAISRGAP
jgi:hypothetical protein